MSLRGSTCETTARGRNSARLLTCCSHDTTSPFVALLEVTNQSHPTPTALVSVAASAQEPFLSRERPSERSTLLETSLTHAFVPTQIAPLTLIAPSSSPSASPSPPSSSSSSPPSSSSTATSSPHFVVPPTTLERTENGPTSLLSNRFGGVSSRRRQRLRTCDKAASQRATDMKARREGAGAGGRFPSTKKWREEGMENEGGRSWSR